MKAYYMARYGGPEVMTYGDLPDPVPGKGDVLVAVKASSVNPVDWKVRRGDMRIVTGRRFPRALGVDLAGVVEATGSGVTGLEPGTRVYGSQSPLGRRSGGHAEKAAVKAEALRIIPAGMDFEQAATLPVAALTALHGLRQCGDLSGRRVLVNGATGGVGHFALQMARARGALVTAVCSARNAEVAEALGAIRIINYRTSDFTREDTRYDVIFDVYGQMGFSRAAPVLGPQGIYITPLPGPRNIAHLVLQKVLRGKQVVLANMRGRPEDFEELEGLVLGGAVKPHIHKVFPLSQAAEAFAAQQGGGIPGKVVVKVA